MNTHSLDNEWAQKYSFHISEQIREKEANLVDLAVILFLRPYPSSPLTSQCVTWSSTKQDSKDILNVVLFRSHNCREANTISVSNDGFLPLSLTIYRSLSPFWLENFFNSCNCVQIVNHLIWYFRETDSQMMVHDVRYLHICPPTAHFFGKVVISCKSLITLFCIFERRTARQVFWMSALPVI